MSVQVNRRTGMWALLAVVVVAALAFGTLDQGEPSADQRARRLEESIRCPQCRSQSVAQSDTPSARGVKTVIQDQIAAGRTDEEIRDFVASAYGREVLLEPSGSGFSGVVWGLPVAVAIVAVGGLVYRFRDWRPATAQAASPADEALVTAALAKRQSDSSAGEAAAENDEGSR